MASNQKKLTMTMPPSCRFAAVLPALLLSASIAAAVGGGGIRFNRDIRPVLSDNCFHCHGPDPGTRKAGLRLDTEEGLYGERQGGAAIVRGKPEQSPLYERLITKDPDDLMPPPESHKALKPEQIELFRKWIAAGAPWEKHWAFIPPTRPAVPKVKDPSWVRTPVDAFILAALEAKGLKPAPEADRRTLIRRVTLDLTGLPPTAAEVAAFVNDKSRDAYEKAVNRLLASPRYGEHRARYWLDAARYADTHGLHFDNYREIWPYRDWVIGAFNRNLRFDRFTLEQLAGDLLPDATDEQLIATGFHRCAITTNEGGTIDEENAANLANDRVTTTAWVWLGLSANCAACHDHKFDPVTMKDFYSMAAFFRNTTQGPKDGNVPDSAPVILVPPETERENWRRLEKESTELTQQLEARRTAASAAFNEWAKSPAARALPGPLRDQEVVRVDFREGQGSNVIARVQGREVSVPFGAGLGWTNGPANDQALQFSEGKEIALEGVPALDLRKPFTLSILTFVAGREADRRPVTVVSQRATRSSQGWMLEIFDRVARFRIIGTGRNASFTLQPSAPLPLRTGRWVHLAVTGDGSGKREGLTLWVDGKPFSTPASTGGALPIPDVAGAPLRFGHEPGNTNPMGGAVADFRWLDREVSAAEIERLGDWRALAAALAHADKPVTGKPLESLRRIYFACFDEAGAAINESLAKVERARQRIRQVSAVTHVQRERMDMQPTAFVLMRGAYDKPGEKVGPAVFAALNPLPKNAPPNRLGLAQWLVDDQQPLTARVTVNRFWQEIFGTGLVRTAEDFGVMGENPSHPELLDWLAVEFRESGWNVKEFFRLLVTSSAYRQAAVTTKEKLEKDPANRLLSRGPRFRMDAEMVRDYALAAAGLLSPKIGGPSVKPYQPDGVWEAIAMNVSNTRVYQRDTGENLYRRSLYTFWKRQAPPALMDVFNAPSREVCTVRRERSNTPLQALATLNDVTFIEAARALAQRALKDGRRTFESRLNFMTERLLARPFHGDELKVAKTTFAQLEKFYSASEAAAKELLGVGETTADASLPPATLATWTMLANQLMNLDEVLNK
jgi:hypothetical protein